MSLFKTILNWRPITPFYYGWLIMAMLAVATFAATGVTQVVLGGIQGFIFDDTGWNRSTVALAVTIGTWTSGFLSPFVGRLADRYGPRWLMPIGAIVVAASFFSLSGAHGVGQFYIAYILGRGISNPILIGVVPRTTAVNFFEGKRNLVLALSSLFRPLGGAVNIQIISAIAMRHSWRTAYRYLGFISIALIPPLIIIMRRRPEDIGLLPDGAQPESREDSGTEYVKFEPEGGSKNPRLPTVGKHEEISWTTREAIGTKAFWLIGITAVLSILVSSTVGFSMVPYLRDSADISTAQAAGVLSLSTFLSLANLGWAYFADKFTPRRLLIFSLMATGAMIIYLQTVDSLLTAYIFGFAWGTFSGTVGVLEQMMLAQYFGRRSFGTITALLSPLQMGALGLGPFLGAFVHDATGSYNELFISMSGLYIVGALLIFKVRSPRKLHSS